MINTIFSDKLPAACSGFVRKNEDDSYTIVLNANHSYDQQRATYKHELSHIINCDHDKQDHINFIEHIRHI